MEVKDEVNSPAKTVALIASILLLSALNTASAQVALLATDSSAGATGRQEDFFPLKDVKPGMKGTGKTVFKGTKVEQFEFEVLGVLRNIGPNQNAILVKLSGGPLSTTGVYAGMSGSPVYIDGKLLGAIAFAIPFSKEPIAGVTPIEEMVKIFEEAPSVRVKTRSRISLSKLSYQNVKLLPLIGNDVDRIKLTGLISAQHPELARLSGQTLTMISTPIVLSGFAPQAISYFAPQLQALGLLPVIGGASAEAEDADDTPLEPGSTISVQLVRGDLDLSASGTVTYVSGDRVYAFGHRLLSIGFTDLPLNKAKVLGIVPSLAISEKISVTNQMVGSIHQDRATGILGTIGRKPKLIPVTVTLFTSRNAEKTFRYEVVNDRFLSPFLMAFTLFSTIVSSERALGDSTIQVKGRILIKDHPEVNIEDSFSDEANSPMFASLAIAAPLNFLLSSGFENLELEGIEVEVVASEESRQAVLDRIWYDKTRLAPGEEINITTFLKKANGEEIVNTYPLRIPEDITPGPLFILVGDGNAIAQMDAREVPQGFIPEDLNQLIKAINNLKKNDRLYVRLYRQSQGVVIKGEGLPGLPPSILSVLSSRKTSGGTQPINLATLAEYELPPTDHVVSGQRIIEVEVIKR